jgi:hypothetical protein
MFIHLVASQVGPVVVVRVYVASGIQVVFAYLPTTSAPRKAIIWCGFVQHRLV